ncbi:hypothetical protein QN277_015627 [Acacia crassicarpa]|uniref:Uncharacterized protein n=1 Tax=Acacia crassicarpa TaxID=499986 RepID=A0AAE1JYV3_9FABA|nr:hypothetical protein QN277_015627 [Acacia crassicarpa]
MELESTGPKSLAIAIFLLSFIIFCSNHNYVSSSPSQNPSRALPKQSLPTKSGYLSVNHTSKSAIFYAFYEAQNLTSPLSQTPLLIWLQGGPGCSSMFGNFFELSPWRVTKNFKNSQKCHLTDRGRMSEIR